MNFEVFIKFPNLIIHDHRASTHKKLLSWLEENSISYDVHYEMVEKEFRYQNPKVPSRFGKIAVGYKFVFYKKEDAMLFKLTWS